MAENQIEKALARIELEGFVQDAGAAINSKEYYLPFLYIFAAKTAHERANILSDGIFFGGSISMLSVSIS